MKLIGFDMEIAKEMTGGYDHDWREDMPLGISCVGFYYPQDGEGRDDVVPSVYFNNVDGVPQAGGMSAEVLNGMVDEMILLSNLGYKFVTWNGLGFDFPVLAEESGRFEDCKFLALKHIDMMYHFFCDKGYMLGLSAALKGMNMEGKTEGMSGRLAPIMWGGNRDGLLQEVGPDHDFMELDDVGLRMKVLEYVRQDAKVTYDLAHACLERRCLHWVSRSGKDNYLDLRQSWMTVEEATDLPLPDTSWMTSNSTKDRSYFTGWMDLR